MLSSTFYRAFWEKIRSAGGEVVWRRNKKVSEVETQLSWGVLGVEWNNQRRWKWSIGSSYKRYYLQQLWLIEVTGLLMPIDFLLQEWHADCQTVRMSVNSLISEKKIFREKIFNPQSCLHETSISILFTVLLTPLMNSNFKPALCHLYTAY